MYDLTHAHTYPLDGVQLEFKDNSSPSTALGVYFNSAFKSELVFQDSVKVRPIQIISFNDNLLHSNTKHFHIKSNRILSANIMA